MKAKCPACDADVKIEKGAELNEIIPCPECNAQLEIVKIDGDKVELEEVKVEEDWGE